MRLIIISISILLLLGFFSIAPSFAQTNEQQIPHLTTVPNELISTENEEITKTTNYVDELNKLGIAGRPESDNAAAYYQNAIELYIKKPEEFKISTGSWPSEQPAQQQTLLRQWVHDNGRALEQLQLGSRKSYCWFILTGQNLQAQRSLTEIRNLAKALQARAIIQAEDGNISNATEDLFTLYKIGAQLTAGPKPLVEKLVGIAVKSLSIKAAFNILEKEMLNAGMMKNLQDILEQVYAEYDEPFDIRYEKFYLQEQVETDPKYSSFQTYLTGTLQYYDTMAAKTPWQLHNEQIQSADEENPLIESIGPSICRLIELDYRSRADAQALIITLAALRYNADKSGYPAELSELVSAGYIKEVPIDPFSNKPFVYKQTKENFTLYSFGADYDDDGGLHSNWGAVEGGDQVFWPVQATAGPEQEVAEQEPSIRPQRDRQGIEQNKPLTWLEQEKANRALFQAVVNGDVEQVQLLISSGADINSVNRMGRTPLHIAIREGQMEVFNLLIDKGANINIDSTKGVRQSPLLFAVDLEKIEVVELLIEKGADINAVDLRGDNALSLAKRKGYTQITELLLKHGAQEPSLESDEYGMYARRGPAGMALYPDYEPESQPRYGTRTGTVGQMPAQIDVLAEPNEIRARIKTFEGLEKALKEITDKSQSEMRLWQRIITDNRTSLIRAVQKQLEEEIGFIRKIAIKEEAKKTVEQADTLLSMRQERFGKISKEILMQRRELRQTQSTRTRGRTRTSGRSTRGRTTQPQDEYYAGRSSRAGVTDPYTTRSSVRSRMSATDRADESQEQVDPETENEISQWLQTTVDNKEDLANTVNEQLMIELTSIRTIAVEEEAKKTTAAIEGLLLSRQERFEELALKMVELRQKQQLRMQALEQRGRGRSRGGRYQQGGHMEQDNQPGTQVRRR